MNELINNIYCPLNNQQLLELLQKQLNNFFLISEKEIEVLKEIQLSVFNRMRYCFERIDNKYFTKNNKPFFSPYHSGQYLIYLYFYANECHQKFKSDFSLKDKLYYLNKILHSCDIYYEVELPKVFFLEHPLGLVLGRAKYGNNFFAMQGCTVGGNRGVYPIIGENVKMYSNSKILGESTIGNNVLVGANCYIKDSNVPDNTTIFGQYPNLIIKNNK